MRAGLRISPYDDDDESEIRAALHDEFIPNAELRMTGKCSA